MTILAILGCNFLTGLPMFMLLIIVFAVNQVMVGGIWTLYLRCNSGLRIQPVI